MYPYEIMNQNEQPYPLFGEQLNGEPCVIDMSSVNSDLEKISVIDQQQFQAYIEQKMGSEFSWGFSGYLEYRESLLGHLPQMAETKRFFHLGLDVMVPIGVKLFAPLNSVIHDIGYEEGKGNYGGYVLLRHELAGENFYSFYGHLAKESLIGEIGQIVAKGEVFAAIGDFHENGDWFPHVHMQVLTKKGLKEGFISKGYCIESALKDIPELCPSPLHLFRY